jgi:hypothetical protein
MQFLYASEDRTSLTAYNLPSHFSMLCERLEENLVYYLVRELDISMRCRRLLLDLQTSKPSMPVRRLTIAL